MQDKWLVSWRFSCWFHRNRISRCKIIFLFNIANPLLALAQTKAFNGAALGPIQRLFNTFECLGSVVANSMFKTIQDMLVNAVKKGFVNPVVCAVEDFVGAITNQITNTINSALDSVLSPINKLFGLIPNFSGFNLKDRLAGFNNAFRIAGNVLKCIQLALRVDQGMWYNIHELNKGAY